MVCVTHEMGFARQVADRVIFMADGEILEEADPESFFRRPAHPRAQAWARSWRIIRNIILNRKGKCPRPELGRIGARHPDE
jgi:ABC-type glutathione transport system ATPase component